MGALERARAGALATLAVVTLALALGPLAAGARADGDPASDYLLTNRVFLAAQAPTPSPGQLALQTLVAEAGTHGYAIRVALVPSQYDLGAITQLWGRPQLYARFLSIELSQAFAGPLLVVMPQGFGFAWPGHASAGPLRTLAGLRAPGSAGLALAAQHAVSALARARGISLPAPAPVSAHASAVDRRAPAASASPLVWLLTGGVLVAIVLAAAVTVGRRRRRDAPVSEPVAARGRTIPKRVAIPALGGLAALAVGLPIAIVAAVRRPATSTADASAVVTPPPVSWTSGTRPAPDFALTDENGHPVSVGGFRGRPVIVTFVDPLCRNLCPLEAHTLNYVVQGMPAAQRPEIIAVSVDTAADTPADLHLDDRRWELVPQWHWAVGSPAALAAVWKAYEVGVSVVTKRVGELALHYITHSEAAYVVDSSGHMRALFLWPFYPQDVERVLSRVS